MPISRVLPCRSTLNYSTARRALAERSVTFKEAKFGSRRVVNIDKDWKSTLSAVVKEWLLNRDVGAESCTCFERHLRLS